MTQKELERLRNLEKRIKEIAEEEGLITVPNIIFEMVPAKRMIEANAYGFPVNFSHWRFGRDYEKISTIYRHTAAGIPYEQVWNFDEPKAFLVSTNPFGLNLTTIAHVFPHVDFFRASRYCLKGREISDVAEQARNAAQRFQYYEDKYGHAEVEKVIDVGMSIQWHLHPDPFFEEPDEEEHRRRLIDFERQKLIEAQRRNALGQKGNAEEIKAIEKRIEKLQTKTPLEPTYDLVNYIVNHSSCLKPWMKDVLMVLRAQARALVPNAKTKMLNEGWATYWHSRIMRRLFHEGLITSEEHGTFAYHHSMITAEHKLSLNVYRLGSVLYEYIEDRWNKGQFGDEYDRCQDPRLKAQWDTGAGLGKQKIFEVRAKYTDRMAIEEFLTPEFVHQQRLYIYGATRHEDHLEYQIIESDPEVIRAMLLRVFSGTIAPLVQVVSGNGGNGDYLYLRHINSGFDLDPDYRNRTLEQIFWLWGKRVALETEVKGKTLVFTYDGAKHAFAIVT